MNTEHTNQPKQAAEAAFEQWWQRHGLTDPMDDEDRQYATASSWARRGYLAAMGLATIKDSLTVAQQAEQAQQAEPVACQWRFRNAAENDWKNMSKHEHFSFRANPDAWSAYEVRELYAQPPAVAVPQGWASVAQRVKDSITWLLEDTAQVAQHSDYEAGIKADHELAEACQLLVAMLAAAPQADTEGCACKECGSTNLTWHTSNVIRSNVQQGRLNTNDVECLFYLGCDDCSETLMSLRADKVAGLLGSIAAAQKGGTAC